MRDRGRGRHRWHRRHHHEGGGGEGHGGGGHEGHGPHERPGPPPPWRGHEHPLHEHLDRHFRQIRAHHLRHRHRWHHYFGAHLHRRLFMWFGATILATGVTGSLLAHALSGAGRFRVFLVVAAVWMMLWGMSGKVARRIARPLREILRVTKEIGAGKLSARAELPYWREGEMALLAGAVNDMAGRIERQIQDQRELLAGVSHEIRTPLARIRVLLELARDGGPDAGAVDEIEREVLEIDALVGQLLASARLDFAEVDLRPLDAADVAKRALERAGVACDGVLAVDDGGGGAGALAFQGDPTLLARALANLLENARRHGGGVKRLRARACAGGGVAFDVEDAGPGFPDGGAGEGKAERGDRAAGEKGKPRAEGSLGLGLVLVRRIADAHRGKLALDNRPEGGARATLEVPQSAEGAGPLRGPPPDESRDRTW